MKAVIFDIDNTIYSYNVCDKTGVKAAYSVFRSERELSEPDFLDALKAAKEYTKLNNRGTASSHNRMLYFQNVCEQFGVLNSDMVLALYNAYWDSFLNEMTLFPMVKETMDMLKKNNIKIAFCTDLTANIQFRKLSRLNLRTAANAIVTSEECGTEKPDPKIFAAVLKKLGEKPSEAVMVGDDLKRDIEGAEAVGISPIWLSPIDEERYRLTASDFYGVYNILKGLCGHG